MDEIQAGLLRALCFHDVWGYPPTHVELFSSWDRGPRPSMSVTETNLVPSTMHRAWDELKQHGVAVEHRGRVVFSGRENLISDHEQRESLFPRKLRQARYVARWLGGLQGVRFVALCNTTALAHARDEGDLDFFVVSEQGMLWQTRGWGVLPYKLFNRRPRPNQTVCDAVCLSFFIDDAALDLSALQLSPDDVYFRHWFLSLLPLYDDGVSSDLWLANRACTDRHPFAYPWALNPSLYMRPWFFVPTPRPLERLAQLVQRPFFSPTIRPLMNQDTRVVVTDHVLKFHTEDRRATYAQSYEQNCRKYGIEP